MRHINKMEPCSTLKGNKVTRAVRRTDLRTPAKESQTPHATPCDSIHRKCPEKGDPETAGRLVVAGAEKERAGTA